MPRDTSKEHVPTYDDPRRRRRARPGAPRPDQGDPDRRPPAPARRLHGEHLVPEDARGSTASRSTIGKSLEVRLGAREQQAPQDAVQGRRRLARARVRRRRLRADRHAPTTARTCCTAAARSACSRTRPRPTSSRRSSASTGLAFEGDASGDPHDFIQQDNETDWDFIWRLAERCGFEFVVEDQKRALPQAGPRRRGRAGVAEDAVVLPPADDRRPAGRARSASAPTTRRRSRRSRRSADGARAARADRDRPPDASADAFPEADGARRHRAGQVDGGGRPRSPRRCSTSSPTATSPPRAPVPATRRSRPGVDGRRQGRRQHVQRHATASPPRRTCCAAAAPTRRASPTRRRHTILGAIGNGATGRARLQRAARARHRHQQQRPRRTSAACACGTRRSSSETEGAWARIADRERRQGARAADAPRRRRGGARRLRARRHHAGPTCSARCSTARTRRATDLLHDKDGSFALLERQGHPDAGEGDVTIKADGKLIDRGRRQGRRRRSKRDWTPRDARARPRSRPTQADRDRGPERRASRARPT